MTRSDTDTWDLASSVGATATMVAAARALATEDTDPIINDPFAAPLVRAVGIDFFTRVVDGDIDQIDAGENGTGELQTETDSLAVRTKFFDDFFTGAAAAGIRQSVILAAGLDSRAYRLNWPAGSIVYEVDQPQVVAFKTETMASPGRRADGAAPHGQHRPARRLADGIARDWFRRHQTVGVERRGLVDVSAARSAGPALRPHHRAQRAGQPDCHRIPPGQRLDDGRTRQSDERSMGQHRLRCRPVGPVLRR